MKKFRLLVLAFAAMLAGTQNGVAQDWPGHTPNSLVGETGHDGEVYLWNVGTGQFLYIGGNWGTQAITYDTGTRFTIANQRHGSLGNYYYTYTLQSHLNMEGNTSGYLTLTNGSNYTSVHDNGIWFVDQNVHEEEFRELYFTSVGGDNNNYYYVSVNIPDEPSNKIVLDYGAFGRPIYDENYGSFRGEEVYLVADGRNGRITNTTSTPTNNQNAMWQLVTLTDIRDNFQSGTANAAYATPLDATYILWSQHFNRKNNDISNWHTGDVNSNNENNTSLTINYPDISFDTYENRMLAPTSTDVPQYYVGNGYAKNDDSDNGYYDNSTESMKEGESHQKLYGNYWTANIKGDGAIWQKVRVTVDYPGWYIISCDGLTTKTLGKVELFASTYSDASMTKPLNTRTSEFTTVTAADGAPETYTAAGQLLYTNETYQKQLLIYVDDSKPYLVIGVRAEGVNDDAWTCVDNFRIQYAGNAESNIVLDENQPDIYYINAQVDPNHRYNLILGRKMINDAWNSLILPVDLTRQQLQLAFGNNVKLSEKNTEPSENPYIIEFTSIDISGTPENETVLKAGVPYIIKPTRLLLYDPADEGYEYEVIDRQNNNTPIRNIRFDEPYFIINQVMLKNRVEDATVTGNGGDAYNCGNAGDILFKGTYTQQSNVIPAGSYLLSNGQWYHMTVDVNSVKGFRTWLEPVSGDTDANVIFSVDGVIDGNEPTAIEGIVNGSEAKADNKVYNMNGQVVRNSSASLEGLPKGVYIVNNKKYIVK